MGSSPRIVGQLRIKGACVLHRRLTPCNCLHTASMRFAVSSATRMRGIGVRSRIPMTELLMGGGKRFLSDMSLLSGTGNVVRRLFGCIAKGLASMAFGICTTRTVHTTSKMDTSCCTTSRLINSVAASKGNVTRVSGLPLKHCCVIRGRATRNCILSGRPECISLACHSRSAPLIACDTS